MLIGGPPRLKDGVVIGYPKQMRRCPRGHTWHSTGTFTLAHHVFSSGAHTTLMPDKTVQTEDLCPFCLVATLNAYCGGVEVVDDIPEAT